MSEQWTWEPVENKTDIRCSCESTDCSKALIVAYDEIQIYDVHMGGGFSFLLPPDLRLCRRVPVQGVPVEVREAMRTCAATVKIAFFRKNLAYVDAQAALAADRIEKWLASQQPQPGQEGNE